MGVEINHSGKVLVISPSGEIDHHAAADIRIEADAAIQTIMPEKVVMDMAGVTLMDSSGIGLILGRQRLAMSLGCRLVVVRPGAQIRKMLTIAGLTRLIEDNKALSDKMLPDKTAQQADTTDRQNKGV